MGKGGWIGDRVKWPRWNKLGLFNGVVIVLCIVVRIWLDNDEINYMLIAGL
jgi:hypothetical protein